MSSRIRWLANAEVGRLPVVDVVVACALGTGGAIAAASRHEGMAASLGVLAMTLPVAWCRRAPVSAAFALMLGALFNALLFGSMVRCGWALPAVFLVGFFVGARRTGRQELLGIVFCAGNVVVQSFYDPRLGASAILLLLLMLGLFDVLGRIVRARTEKVAMLGLRTEELRRQREETARLTVLADRTRVSADLDDLLRERIRRIAATAAAGQDAVSADRGRSLAALESIEGESRDLLNRMREIVGSLASEPSGGPQPSLADLSDLLTRATNAESHLTVQGEQRRLSAGIELACYRIAEHLLACFGQTPDAEVDVRLRFATDSVELRLSGPSASDTDDGASLAAARERVAFHNGTLDDRTDGGTRHTQVRLPLVSAHA
jgi:signal transduction histidine kinase